MAPPLLSSHPAPQLTVLEAELACVPFSEPLLHAGHILYPQPPPPGLPALLPMDLRGTHTRGLAAMPLVALSPV